MEATILLDELLSSDLKGPVWHIIIVKLRAKLGCKIHVDAEECEIASITCRCERKLLHVARW